MNINDIQQIVFYDDAQTIEHTADNLVPDYEVSVLAGANTLCIGQRITKASRDALREVYAKVGFIHPTYAKFEKEIGEHKYEPVLTEMPPPDEPGLIVLPLNLQSGNCVYLVIRPIKMEVDNQSLTLAH